MEPSSTGNAHSTHRADDSAARNLSTKEAAAYCGVSTSFLNKLRCAGGGAAFFKVGRRVLYSRAELDAWLQRQRRVSTSDSGEVA